MHVAGTFSQRMGVETIDSCREDGRGEKADRSEAKIRKLIHLRYCQEQIHVQILRLVAGHYPPRPNNSRFSDCVCDANGV